MLRLVDLVNDFLENMNITVHVQILEAQAREAKVCEARAVSAVGEK